MVLRDWKSAEAQSCAVRQPRCRLSWLGFCERFSVFLPPLQILQPYPNARFDAKHPSIRGKNRVR
jgi:hypothetical protein